MHVQKYSLDLMTCNYQLFLWIWAQQTEEMSKSDFGVKIWVKVTVRLAPKKINPSLENVFWDGCVDYVCHVYVFVHLNCEGY